MYINGRINIEEGRGQEAEGRRSNRMGIQTPTDCEHRADGGVLYPVGSGQTEQRVLLITFLTYSSLLPSALCPLPSPDNM
jgi:hypothetical protein